LTDLRVGEWGRVWGNTFHWAQAILPVHALETARLPDTSVGNSLANIKAPLLNLRVHARGKSTPSLSH